MTKFKSAVIAFIFLSYPVPALAQSPSPTPASIRDSVRQQVDQELAQIKQSVSKKAYVGSVSAKSDGSLTIATLTNQSRTALVTADAAIKLSGGKDGTPADLKVGDFVLAMGDADGQGLLTVKRLLVIPQPRPDNRVSLFGSVTQASASSLTLTASDQKTYTLKLQSATKYTKLTKAADIKTGFKIAVVGTSASDTALTAKIIHLLP